MTANLKHWIIGLFSTAISAGAGSITVIAIDPTTFNLNEGFINLLKVAAVSAFIAIANYLKQKPLPGCEDEKNA